jgi:hypothetical protein
MGVKNIYKKPRQIPLFEEQEDGSLTLYQREKSLNTNL